MKEHQTIPRTFIVSDQDLSDPESSAIAFRFIFSAMLFPEDAENREKWIMANILDLLNLCSRKQVRDIFSKYPDLAAEFFYSKDEIIKVAKSVTYSRQSSLGRQTVKGMTAGSILYYMAQSHIGSLTKAYEEYHLSDHRLHGNQLTTSTSTLKNIWADFKHVSHFWAARHAYVKNYDDILFRGLTTESDQTSPNHSDHLFYFLKLTSFFRLRLTDAVDVISDFDKVWNIVSETNRPFPPAKMKIEKNDP